MSTAVNNLIREVNPGRSLFPNLLGVLSTSSSFNQGDLVKFDTVNKILNATTGAGDGALVVGCAIVTIVKGFIPSPYGGTAVDASQAIEDAGGPLFGNVFQLVVKTGDTFNPGDKAYLTSDPQTVTSSATGSAVAYYVGTQAITSAPSGTLGDFMVGAPYQSSLVQT